MKIFTFCSFAMVVVNGLMYSQPMQSTGTKPDKYEYFNLPWESLSIAARYLPENPVIVEAGAFDGRESCTLAKYWPQGHVHSFEPVNQLFNLVKTNTQSMPNISAYKLALGAEVGLVTMYLSEEESWAPGNVSMSSSLYAPKDHLLHSSTQFKRQEVVDVTTLDHWATENNISHIDMLWLDMQGYELPALKSAQRILPTVSVILTELEFCEAYEGQPLYREVRSWLEEQGFVLVAGNFRFPKERTQWFGDGLFVRKDLVK